MLLGSTCYIITIFILAIGLDIWWVWGHQRYRLLRESALTPRKKSSLIIEAFFPILMRISWPDRFALKAFLVSKAFIASSLLALTVWLVWLSLRALQKIGAKWQPLTAQDTWQLAAGWGILIMSFVVFIVLDKSIRGGKHFESDEISGDVSSQAETRLRIWQWLCLAGSLFLAYMTSQAAGMQVKMANPPAAMVAWFSAIGLVVLGTISFQKKRVSLAMRLVIPMILLGLLAFTIRAYDIGKLPNALNGDEATFGMSAVAFMEDQFTNIFRAGFLSFPILYSSILSLSIRLFGRTAEAIRLSSAFIGALTVAALYPFTLKMFGKKTALFASIFLAAFHYHIAYSRMALNNIWDSFWFVWVLGFLWQGWYSERRAYFVLAGLGLGLGQYFYASAHFLLLLAPAWILFVGLLDRPRLKRNLVGLFCMTLAAVVIVLPLILFYIHYPDEFQAPLVRVSVLGDWMENRIKITGLSSWQIMLKQVGLSLGGLFIKPLIAFYEPGTPLLRLAPAVLFVLGIAGLARKIHQPRAILLFLWLVGYGIAGAFSLPVPASQRYVAVAPAAAIVVGYGLSALIEQAGQLWPRHARFIAVLGIGMIFLAAAGEMRFFFVDYKQNHNMGGFNTMVAQRLGDFLKDKEAGWEVVFFGYPEMGYKSFNTMLYLAPHIKGYTMVKPWGSDGNPTPAGWRLIFVFLPSHADDLSRVKASYPGGVLREEYYRKGELLYWLYEVER